uniref:proteasome endopeptidase complex n=1 Tax=Globodera rostochiensis TaxID=31243 RepID=A0A914IC45_GLORO
MFGNYYSSDCSAVPAFPLGYHSRDQQTTGTTLVAMECKGGIAVATDSRTSMGSFIAVLLRAGVQSDSQAMADVIMYYAESNATMDEDDEIFVRNVANYARKMHYNYRGQIDSTLIVAGYDSIKKGQVYAITSGGYTTRQPYHVSGSGGTFIHEFIQSRWSEGIEGEVAREILKTAIFEAQRRDTYSGGLIHTALIDKNGTSRKTYRPDKEDFPTVLPVKAYPNLPEHILQPRIVEADQLERME